MLGLIVMKIRNALILGGSSDIGVELIKLLEKKNFYITAQYNSNSRELIKLSKKNKKLKLVKINFKKTNQKKLKILLKNNFKEKYDIFVNLIGYMDGISYEKTNLNSLIEALKINSLIPMLILKKIYKKMLLRSYGRILNCSSIGVKFGGGAKSFNYSFSKHANEFIPFVIRGLAKKNIIINNIRIGVTDTKIHKKVKNQKQLSQRKNLIPIKRLSSKLEIANYLLFLISEENSYMTNETITVAGGE